MTYSKIKITSLFLHTVVCSGHFASESEIDKWVGFSMNGLLKIDTPTRDFNCSQCLYIVSEK